MIVDGGGDFRVGVVIAFLQQRCVGASAPPAVLKHAVAPFSLSNQARVMVETGPPPSPPPPPISMTRTDKAVGAVAAVIGVIVAKRLAHRCLVVQAIRQ